MIFLPDFIFWPIQFHDLRTNPIGSSVGKYLLTNQGRERITKPVERGKLTRHCHFFGDRDGLRNNDLDISGRQLFRNLVGYFFSFSRSCALLLDQAFQNLWKFSTGWAYHWKVIKQLGASKKSMLIFLKIEYFAKS